MFPLRQKITIIHVKKPQNRNLNRELQWLGNSLGLFSSRDKDKSCFRLFIEIVKAAKKGAPLSSDDLADKLGLSRGTVIHHINRLMEAGIIVREGRMYSLRVDSLRDLIHEIRKDLKRTIDDLEETAEKLDKVLGF